MDFQMLKNQYSGCCDGNHFNRRDFMRVGALSYLGISLGQFLQLENALAAEASVSRAKAQACIMVWLDGGPSQMDTWDPKPTSSFKPISTNVPGIQISELFPRCAQHMDKLSLIRSMHTEENNHMRAHHYALTGQRPNPALQFPSLGTMVGKEMGQRGNMPPNVMISGVNDLVEEYFKAKFLGAQYDPMIIPEPDPLRIGQKNENKEVSYQITDLSLPKIMTEKRIQNRLDFSGVVDRFYRQKAEQAEFQKMDTFTEQAWNMILSPDVREAFELSKESEKTREQYGHDAVGRSMLLARRLVEAGCRFVTAAGYSTQQWDSHTDNDVNHRDYLVPPLDRSLSTLLEDLEQRGMLDSTLVIVMGEFGRTPDISPNLGRDHWPECWSMALAGGGIRGGQVIGESDERGAYVADRMVTIGDLYATVYKAFGIDWRHEYMHPIGRPIKIASSINGAQGMPIEELV
jgi:hypothetical protein